jgi:hypothetical protein
MIENSEGEARYIDDITKGPKIGVFRVLEGMNRAKAILIKITAENFL